MLHEKPSSLNYTDVQDNVGLSPIGQIQIFFEFQIKGLCNAFLKNITSLIITSKPKIFVKFKNKNESDKSDQNF